MATTTLSSTGFSIASGQDDRSKHDPRRCCREPRALNSREGTLIQCERLLLRPLTESDDEAIAALDADPEVIRYANPYLLGSPRDLSAVRAEVLPRYLSYRERDARYGYWAAMERSISRFIGWFHLYPREEYAGALDLGYRLRRDAWGRGYATEGARALVRKGFEEFKADRIIASTLPENSRSIRVIEKLGMQQIGTRRWRDLEFLVYAIDRNDYRR
jgi:RimJ/RimL family protein N-acetyltransferase